MTGDGLVSAPAKERQDARETRTLDADRPRLLHILSLDGIHGICGSRLRDPNGPVIWCGRGPDSCIVCDNLWDGLPGEIQDAIYEFAKGRS